MNSTVTNFNLPGLGYGYMNTINALNMCYYQKYFLENGLYNGNSNCAFVGAESCGTHKKETSLKEIFDKTNKREKQNDSIATFAKVITREDEHIDFNKSALEVHNKIRGLSSIPCAYATLDDQNIKIYLSSQDDCNNTNEKPGTITRVDKDSFYVACQDKEIKILQIQVPGKNKVFVKDYLNGKPNIISKIFK